MKNILIFLMLFISINLFGQVNKDNKTDYGSNSLVSSKEKLVTSFIGFDGQFNNFLTPSLNIFKKNKYNFTDPTMSAGVTLGSTIDRAFTIGVTTSWIFDTKMSTKDSSTFAWYAGILLEPTIFPKFPIHLTFPCIVGGGDVSISSTKPNYLNVDNDGITHNLFFIISVGTRLELNVANGIRVSCGPSWRYIPKNKENNIISYLNNSSFDFSIKIGKY